MENEEIKHYIHELIQKGHLQPISSPCGIPIVLVQKKDGTWKICNDYRALKKIIIKNRYQIPWIDELVDEMHGETFFSKIYLRFEYHQIGMREEDI